MSMALISICTLMDKSWNTQAEHLGTYVWESPSLGGVVKSNVSGLYQQNERKY